MDLRISRLVQIVHTIQTVQKNELILRRGEMSWQTQAICTFLANTIEDDKARAQMVKVASRLTLLDEGDLEDSEVDTNFSERTLEDIIENGSIAEAMRENNRKGLNASMLGKLGA